LRKIVIFLVIVVLFPPTGTKAQRERLNIVTTTSILADVVQNVAGDAADVTSLMDVGTDPHSFQPTTRDIIALDEANLIFINGIRLEGGLREILSEIESDQVIPMSACVTVLTGLDHEVEHEDDDSHEVAAVSGDLGKQCMTHYEELGITPEGAPLYDADCEDCDPHVWMDVQNVMLWTLFVRDTLSDLDPGNADLYADNCAAYLKQLRELDSDIQDLVESIPEDNRLLVTNHNVLNYFATRYGFEIAATILPGFSTGAEPGPQEILEVIQILEDADVPAIFVDNSANADTAEQIADEAEVEVIMLYTGSLSADDAEGSTYIDYMRFNTSQIVGGLTTD
jgi:zinc/manganese transport system substrate-binding protein